MSQGPLPLSWPPSLHSVGRLPVSLGLEPMDLCSLLSCSPLFGATLSWDIPCCLHVSDSMEVFIYVLGALLLGTLIPFPLIPVPGTESVFSGVGRVYIPLTELLPT